MAEGDGVVFNNFKEQVLLKQISLASGGDELKVCLVTGWTPDITGSPVYSTISGNEESGTGYTAGGEVLASQAVTQDDINNLAKFDASDVTWAGLDVGTPSHAILYDNTTASKWLIAYWILGRASNGGNYTLQWNANGILTLT
jgi:hypothetical protein